MSPLLIGVGGGGSGSGKTTLACSILREAILKEFSGQGGKWGAIKYTKTPLYASIIEDIEILKEKGKDTAMFLESGAEGVLWVQSPKEGLSETLSTAVGMLSHLDGIVVEGNGAIEVLRPDIVIFIFKASLGIKPGAERILRAAEIVVGEKGYLTALETSHAGQVSGAVFGPVFEPGDEAGFFSFLKGLVAEKEIIKELKEKAFGGRLSCAEAQEIAKRLGAEPKEVRKAADMLGIKITDCQMGCF